MADSMAASLMRDDVRRAVHQQQVDTSITTIAPISATHAQSGHVEAGEVVRRRRSRRRGGGRRGRRSRGLLGRWCGGGARGTATTRTGDGPLDERPRVRRGGLRPEADRPPPSSAATPRWPSGVTPEGIGPAGRSAAPGAAITRRIERGPARTGAGRAASSGAATTVSVGRSTHALALPVVGAIESTPATTARSTASDHGGGRPATSGLIGVRGVAHRDSAPRLPCRECA